MNRLLLAACVALASCAASPRQLGEVARTESARLVRPSRALSSFAEYELKPLALSPELQADAKKVAESSTLETRLKAKIEPLLAQWRAAPAGTRAGILVIEPQLADLRIVSGGARFWAGAMAGDSTIDFDLQLIDQGTSLTIAKVRIARDAGAWAGGWSIGKSDQNLHDYVAAIAYQYLLDSY